MKLIVTGPDCAGKSSLVNGLVSVFGFTLIKIRRLDDKYMMNIAVDKWINRMRTEHILFDRFYYPEDILYEPLFDSGQRSVLESRAEVLEKIFNELGVLFVYVTAQPEVLRARFRVRGDEVRNEEQILKIADVYEDFFSKTKLNYIRIDSSVCSISDMIEHAALEITRWHLTKIQGG